jgi:hypothetical protein
MKQLKTSPTASGEALVQAFLTIIAYTSDDLEGRLIGMRSLM